MNKKKYLTIAVIAVTLLIMFGALFILLHDDKPVYVSQSDLHEYISGSDYTTISFEFGPDVTGKKYCVELKNGEDEAQMGKTMLSFDGGEYKDVLDKDGYSGYLVNSYGIIDNSGNAYLIVNMNEMSDDYAHVIYRIKDREPSLIESGYGLIEYADTELNLKLVSRIDICGTWFASQDAELIGGRINPKSKEYSLPTDCDREITALEDINAYFLNDEGEYKAGKLKKGTKLELYATDGSTYVLFTCADGRKGKLKCEKKNYMTYIDGKQDDEIFAGIRYAG